MSLKAWESSTLLLEDWVSKKERIKGATKRKRKMPKITVQRFIFSFKPNFLGFFFISKFRNYTTNALLSQGRCRHREQPKRSSPRPHPRQPLSSLGNPRPSSF